MKKAWAPVLVFAVAAAIWGLARKEPAPPSTEGTSAPAATSAVEAARATVPGGEADAGAAIALPRGSSAEPNARSTGTPAPSVADGAPRIETLRDEVRANPHAAPPSLVSFAASLAPKMEAARRSPEAAEKLFDELRECVASPKLAESRSVRALCLSNIRRLGEKVPALRERAAAELERAEPELNRLAK